MAIEPVFETVKTDSRIYLGAVQTVVEARLLPPAGTIIARVLTIVSDVKSEPSEAFAGEVRFAGKIKFKVLFVGDEGKCHETEYVSDFSDKLQSDSITADVRPIVSSDVLDVDVTGVSGGEIKLAAVVETKVWADENREIKYLGSADAYVEESETAYCRLVARGKSSAEYAAAIENVKLRSIMFAEHKIVVSERSAGADSVRASGVIISDICGETEDGLIASYRVETPFSEEWGADGASVGDAVFVRACVSGKENLAADGETYAVDLNYEIAFDYSVYAPDRVTLVCDLFSSDRELIVGSESAPVNIAKGGYTITDRVEGNVTLEVNMPLADNILAATGTRLTVTNLLASDDEVLIEGIVSGSVIYYSAEDNVTSGALVELPFSITSRLDGARTGDELCGRGTVTSTSLKIRRGNEIDIKADIAVEIESVRPENVTVITSVEEGETIVKPTAAFSIHVTKKGETLWEVSKALGATPETIIGQNQGLTQPFEGGERIVVYRHLTE